MLKNLSANNLLSLVFVCIFFLPLDKTSKLFAQYKSEVNTITAIDRGTGDRFGSSISVSGNYAIIGAHEENDHDGGDLSDLWIGAAYIFEQDSNGNWNQKQKLIASDRDFGDYFGFSVSISGNYAIVGAYNEDDDLNGENSISSAGSAYIFELNNNGIWTQVQKIVPSERGLEDLFGISVSISGDYAIVGTRHELAFIFERNPDGNWIQVQKIIDDSILPIDFFGYAVSISGNFALVGSLFDAGNIDENNPITHAGSAYFFKRDLNGNWNRVQKIVASDRSEYANFGDKVYISGNHAIVGAYNDGPGSAYIFEIDENDHWNEVGILRSSDGANEDMFGYSVSISENYAIVGAKHEDEDKDGRNTLESAGSAYIFDRDDNGHWNQIIKIVPDERDKWDLFGNSVFVTEEQAFVGAIWDDVDDNDDNIIYGAGSVSVFTWSHWFTVSEYHEEIPIKVYPNPSQGQFHIYLGSKYNEVKITVKNILGQLVSTTNYGSVYHVLLEITAERGAYFIEVETREGVSGTFKVLKQ